MDNFLAFLLFITPLTFASINFGLFVATGQAVNFAVGIFCAGCFLAQVATMTKS